MPYGVTARQMMADLMRPSSPSIIGDGGEVSESEILDAIEYYVFPNFVPWGGYSRINYRFRPAGDDPDLCIMDVVLLSPFDPARGRPAPAPAHELGPDDSWTEAPELGPLTAIFEQDTANLPRVQRGLHAAVKPGVTLGGYQESRIRHYHEELTRWMEG